MSLFRLIRSMDSVAIALSGSYLRQVHMPDIIGTFFDSNPVSFLNAVRFVKQTQNSAKFTPSPSHVAPKG
jgi:hypothetical protein